MMFVRADPRETQEVVSDARDQALAFFGGTCIQSTAIRFARSRNFVMIWTTGKAHRGNPQGVLLVGSISSASYAFLTLAKNRHFPCVAHRTARGPQKEQSSMSGALLDEYNLGVCNEKFRVPARKGEAPPCATVRSPEKSLSWCATPSRRCYIIPGASIISVLLPRSAVD
jgi:hypothetical protein